MFSCWPGGKRQTDNFLKWSWRVVASRSLSPSTEGMEFCQQPEWGWKRTQVLGETTEWSLFPQIPSLIYFFPLVWLACLKWCVWLYLRGRYINADGCLCARAGLHPRRLPPSDWHQQWLGMGRFTEDSSHLLPKECVLALCFHYGPHRCPRQWLLSLRTNPLRPSLYRKSLVFCATGERSLLAEDWGLKKVNCFFSKLPNFLFLL